MLRLDIRTHNMLVSTCTGEALEIVNATTDTATGRGSGLEAWRLITKRWSPRTAMRKRRILREILGFQPVKDPLVIESSVRKLEELIKQYEMMGERLSDEIKASILLGIATGALKQHLEFTKP